MTLRTRIVTGAALVALAIVAGLGAARMLAQPPLATPSSQAPAATPIASPKAPIDPTAPRPFSSIKTTPIKVRREKSPEGSVVEYYQFTTKPMRPNDRSYVVEIPSSLLSQPRSMDAWITLFACYGRDPMGDADVRYKQGGAQDTYSQWSAARIALQLQKVTQLREFIGRIVGEMNIWATIHQEAKDNNDHAKAVRAWGYISNYKGDLKVALRKLAREKLTLGHVYKDSGQFDLAGEQYRQTAQINIWPYSAEAISKLRVIEGASQKQAEYTNAVAVGLERMSLSDLFRAAQRATGTTP